MERMKLEKRPLLHLLEKDEHIWLIGASEYNGDADGLHTLWTELEEGNQTDDENFVFASWPRYMELRTLFYTIKRSKCYPGYLSCTCPEGIKDVVCKHVLMLMESEKLIDPLPQPLEGRQKRGRKRKVGRALEMI